MATVDTLKAATESCLHAFAVLCNRLERKDTPYASSLDDVQEEVGRFRVWAGNLGALAKGHSALDWRLRDSDLMRSTIFSLLQQLRDTIDLASAFVLEPQLADLATLNDDAHHADIPDDISLPSDDEQDVPSLSGDVFHNSIRSVVDLVKDLYKLSFRIRNSTTRSSKAGFYKEIDPSSGLDLFGDCFAQFDYNHVFELFRSFRKGSADIDEDAQVLIRRFAKSVTTRRRQFRYWQKHSQKLKTFERSVAIVIEARDAAKLPEKPDNKDTQDGAVRVQAVPSHSERERTIHTYTEATFFSPQLDLAPLESQSIFSVATTARDIEGRPADLPPPPSDASRGEDFVCPYCFVLCPSRHGSGRAWRSHIIQDIQPYICSYLECPTPDRIYGSRREWLEHEETSHRTIWQCRFHSTLQFSSQHSLEKHLQQEHAQVMTADQASDYASISRSIVNDPRQECPICLQTIADIPNFCTHLANHMERIASFALPRHVNDDEGLSAHSFKAVPQSTTDLDSSANSVSSESIDGVFGSSLSLQKDIQEWLTPQMLGDPEETLPKTPDRLSWRAFLDGSQFDSWCKTSPIRHLYCSSSSTLSLQHFTSAVLNELREKHLPNIPILFIPGNSKGALETDLIAGILGRLVTYVPGRLLPEGLIREYHKSKGAGLRPSVDVIKRSLIHILQILGKTYFILDCANRLWDENLEDLELRHFWRIMGRHFPGLSLMILMRDYDNPFPGVDCDICHKTRCLVYFHCTVCNDANFDVCQACKDSGHGCYDRSHALVQTDDSKDRAFFNIDSHHLGTSYRPSFRQRINLMLLEFGQMELTSDEENEKLWAVVEDIFAKGISDSQNRDSALSINAIGILVYARVWLDLTELHHILCMIMPPRTEIPEIKTILEAAGDLVQVDADSRVKSLPTCLESFLEGPGNHWFAQGHLILANAFLQILLTHDASHDTPPSYGYASTYWGYHVQMCLPNPELEDKAIAFLESPSQVSCAEKAACVYRKPASSTDFVPDRTLQPLHICAFFGLTHVIRRFIVAHEADLNSRSHLEDTPMIDAAPEGHAETVKLLLDLGADANLKNSRGSTALHEAVENKRFTVIEVLLASPTVKLETLSSEGNMEPALPRFLDLRSLDILKQALDRDDIEINERYHRGKTALYLLFCTTILDGMDHFPLQAAELIIKHPRFDLNVVDYGGRGYLAQLFNIPDFDMRFLDLLMRHGANIEQMDNWNETVIIHAITLQNNWQGFSKLVELGADLTVKDSRGGGLLHRLVTYPRESQALHYLHLLLGRTTRLVDCQDAQGRTALHSALVRGSMQLAEELLDCGADVNIFDYSGRNAFAIAREYGRWSLLDQIYSKQAQDNVTTFNEQMQMAFDDLPAWAIHFAHAENEHLAIDEAYVRGLPGWSLGYLDRFDKVFWRWSQNDLDMLEPSPDDGNTALHYLIQSKEASPALQEDILRSFLSKDSSCSPRNFLQQTPLHVAILGNRIALAKILIENGADLEARDNSDQTPYLLAKTLEREEILETLREAATRQANIPQVQEPILDDRKVSWEDESTASKDASRRDKDRASPERLTSSSGEDPVYSVDTVANKGKVVSTRGILKQPTQHFPEEQNPEREGVAPLFPIQGVPPGARWTKIDRRLVDPQALEEAQERFEERLDCAVVLRVLTKDEIQKLADRSFEIRESRKDEEITLTLRLHDATGTTKEAEELQEVVSASRVTSAATKLPSASEDNHAEPPRFSQEDEDTTSALPLPESEVDEST